MKYLGLIKNFVATATIPKYRIVGFGPEEGKASPATPASKLLGVSGVRGAKEASSRVDVYMSDIQPVEFGAAVAFGDWLVPDAEGRAIPAAPAADAQVEVIGRAMEAGGEGTIGKAHINVQQITG